eukprot:5439370-Prymnesium_polylepis.1
MAQRTPGTHYFPLGHLMCDPEAEGGKCGAFIPGTTTVGLVDRDHLDNAAAIYLWPFICGAFMDSGLF